MQRRLIHWLLVFLVMGTASGCGRFMAGRMVRSPNRYSQRWAPPARVVLEYQNDFFSNAPPRYVEVGPPSARLRYRVIQPADYRLTSSETNWLARGHRRYRFQLDFRLPSAPMTGPGVPRGTIVLLHGYSLNQATMVPWAMRLAQAGWKCVLVDLRGHGRSTGQQISFGVHEADDLQKLADELERSGQLTGPLAVLGESYGAAVALRWAAIDSRVKSTVAITPYAELAPAIRNLRREFAKWLPACLVNAGIRRLPEAIHVPASELDTLTVLKRAPVRALFIGGSADVVSPATEVERLQKATETVGSELMVVQDTPHEAMPFRMNVLAEPILAWLERTPR